MPAPPNLPAALFRHATARPEEPWLFRVKVIGGAAAFVLLGGVLFLRGRR